MPVPVLRPLSVGEMLDAALKIVVRNFLSLVKATAVVILPAALIVAIIEGAVVTGSTLFSVNQTTGQLVTTDTKAIFGAGITLGVVTFVSTLLASAICYKIVGDAYVGSQPDWRQALRFTARRLHSILWVSVVVGFYFAVLAVGGIIVVALLARAVPALAVLAGIALVVVFVWLVVPAGLAVPTFMMEGIKGAKAYRRAFGLVRGHWWRTLGILLLTAVLAGFVSAVVNAVLGVGLRAALGGTTAGAVLVDFLLFGVTYLCIHPFEGAVLVLLSVDLRVRKEGYDVQLLASHLGLDASTVSLPYTRYAPGWGPTGVAGGPAGAGSPGWGAQSAAPWGSPWGPSAGAPGPDVGGYPPSGWQAQGPPPGGWPHGAAPPGGPGAAPSAGAPAPGWWIASDGRWYPPEQLPATRAPGAPASAGAPAPGWWIASDGRWYPPELHPSVRHDTAGGGAPGPSDRPENGGSPGSVP